MKKINIPTCMNPFEVSVNGVKHSYPAGTEQEVPMGVAMVIEQHGAYHEEKERIAKEGDGSQGGGTGGGYSTCKVHLSFNDYDIGVIYSTLDSNGNPVSASVDHSGRYDEEIGEYVYPSENEYDIEVICGSHIAISDTGLRGCEVQSEFPKVWMSSGCCLFVPVGSTSSSVSLSIL